MDKLRNKKKSYWYICRRKLLSKIHFECLWYDKKIQTLLNNENSQSKISEGKNIKNFAWDRPILFLYLAGEDVHVWRDQPPSIYFACLPPEAFSLTLNIQAQEIGWINVTYRLKGEALCSFKEGTSDMQ